MATLVKRLTLIGNPFEHYTAETEPNIADYAVRPPYLQSISDRARNLSSFILFGNRGAGKSATRITVFNELWKENAKKPTDDRPFIVNLTDFSSLQVVFKANKLLDRDIVALAAFFVVEQVLVWLSSLEEDDREIYIEGLDKSERTLALALLKGFYLTVPEMDRGVSTTDALKLLNSAWYTKSAVWAGKRWDALSSIIAAAVSAFSKKQIDEGMDISAPAEALLKSLTGEAANTARAILSKLTEFVTAFGFSGVCVLIDKIDETPNTANSSEATARLIHPLLSHIQLLEVDRFAWILFLWNNVQDHFESRIPVRLDKIAHANITWNSTSLKEMVEARIRFFSQSRLAFADLFSEELDSSKVFEDLVSMSGSSPRELIKLLDVVIREHDSRGESAPHLIDQVSLDVGQDKYARETIGTWFKEKPLQQVLRLGKASFVNRDVQTIFRITDQGARVRINVWEDAGLVRQSGTAPSELGGKPVNRYVVADARVERIITRKLESTVGAGAEDGEDEAQHVEQIQDAEEA
ncbi:hypothetical protein [Mesorhizobium sp. M7A.F.Ca.MR.176.00.0.0]|uniref:P-loop ATPase, Sll1717 family n=1 Tax=Mesorhizobium sp. M7A.F.Ca.MR.176.00.0.0 TaxID=2496776 RepID=UPI0019D49669|nr:hypothetical protein [Mesorhizobium sp. M7A.F.Ca.MR.176.00.0.0]